MADQDVQLSPEQQLLQKANKYKWVLFGIGAVVVAGNFAGLLISGVEAIFAVGATVAVSAATVYFTPVIAMKAANTRMKMLVGEAEKNPILTLKNDYIFRQNQLQLADDSIQEFDTEIRNYDDQCREFKEQYPDEAANFEEISTSMHGGLKEMKSEQSQARSVVADLSQKIKKAEAIYKMSLAAQRVTSFSRESQEKVFADIKQQVAFDSVRSQLNRSFAALDRAMAKRTELSARAAAPALSSGNPATVQTIEPAPVRRSKEAGR
jgi:predicted  nucleic acid-binding Zn-ribbon protein